jgi:transposase-like protein
MKKITGILVAVAAMLLPLSAVAQYQNSDDNQRHDQGYNNSQGRWDNRLSADDQARFDNYYSRWLDYNRTNNGNQSASMEDRMREVMSRNNIPSDVPFQQIASNQGYNQNRQDDRDDHRQMQVQGGYGDGRDNHSRRHIARFSGSDARHFRSYYSRWQQYRQNDDRDQIASMERRMSDVMNRHNIPNDVSYDEVMDMLNRRNQ